MNNSPSPDFLWRSNPDSADSLSEKGIGFHSQETQQLPVKGAAPQKWSRSSDVLGMWSQLSSLYSEFHKPVLGILRLLKITQRRKKRHRNEIKIGKHSVEAQKNILWGTKPKESGILIDYL